MDFRQWAGDLSRWGSARGRNVILLSTVDSTQRMGLAVATEDELELESWIFALHQSAGRGRSGRPWSSPQGAGVYASWVARVPRSILSTLPLVVGVGLCAGLGSLGYDCRLKWPNDLHLRGAKVGGILLQSRGGADPAAVVCGFGVNLGQRAGDLPGDGATSLALSEPGRTPRLSALAIALACAVEDEVDRSRQADDPAWAVERYMARTVHRQGDLLRIRVGDETCEGEFAGFSRDGHLRLRTSSGERLFAAGEVASARSGRRGSDG